jgi:hypothetical protein
MLSRSFVLKVILMCIVGNPAGYSFNYLLFFFFFTLFEEKKNSMMRTYTILHIAFYHVIHACIRGPFEILFYYYYYYYYF